MPLIQTEHDSRSGAALAYITIGAIMTVLAGTTFIFFKSRFTENDILGYIRVAVLLIGIVLLVIGISIGQIAKAARSKPSKEEVQEEAIKRGQNPPPL